MLCVDSKHTSHRYLYIVFDVTQCEESSTSGEIIPKGEGYLYINDIITRYLTVDAIFGTLSQVENYSLSPKFYQVCSKLTNLDTFPYSQIPKCLCRL